MKMCKSCGTLLDDTNKFCTSCGALQEVVKNYPLEGNSVKREEVYKGIEANTVSKRGIALGIIGSLIGGLSLLIYMFMRSFVGGLDLSSELHYFHIILGVGALVSAPLPFIFGMIGVTARRGHPAGIVCSSISLLISVTLTIIGIIDIYRGFLGLYV